MRYQLYRTKKVDGSSHPKWRIKFFNDDGSYHSQETGTTDKRATEGRAKNKLQEMERDRHNEAMGQSSAPKTLIRSIVADYVKIKSAHGGRRGKGWTAESKYKAVSNLEWWIKRLNLKEIKDVKLQAVEVALAESKAAGESDFTIDMRRNQIKALTRWVTDREILLRDPLRALRRGKVESKDNRRALTPAELVTVLQATRGHDYMLLKGGAVTGLRIRELTGLKVEWVDWKKGVNLPADLIGNKAKKAVLVKMPKDYLQELKTWCKDLQPGDFIFRPAVASNASRLLQGYCLQLGVPLKTKAGKVVFHSLRHSFISMINDLNPDMKTRLNVSRHGDLKTNLEYSHEAEESQERLVEAISAKLTNHIGVTLDTWSPVALANIEANAIGSEICISASSARPRVSHSEHPNPLENRQSNRTGRPPISQPGREVQPHGSHMAKLARQLEDIWALVPDADRQSIVNHARGLLLGLKIHRKGVA